MNVPISVDSYLATASMLIQGEFPCPSTVRMGFRVRLRRLSEYDSVVYLVLESKSSLKIKFVLGGLSRGRLGGYPGGRHGPKTFTPPLGAQEK